MTVVTAKQAQENRERFGIAPDRWRLRVFIGAEVVLDTSGFYTAEGAIRHVQALLPRFIGARSYHIQITQEGASGKDGSSASE